jgi:hypothetical protein
MTDLQGSWDVLSGDVRKALSIPVRWRTVQARIPERGRGLRRTAERSLEGMLAKSLEANCDPAGAG